MKLIDSEGGLDQYINKYKNQEVDFLWHQKRTFWIFAQAYLLYNEQLNDDGSIDLSADFDIDLNTEWKDWLNEETIGLGSSEKNINCLTSDCGNVWAIVEENHGSYLFRNFIPPTHLKNPFDIVLVEFNTGIEDLNIEPGSFMPIPAFFFYAVLKDNNWDIFKRDVSDITTVGTSLFAGGTLIKGAQGISKVAALTLFFNVTNTFVLSDEVISWIENENIHGKSFLATYRLLNVTNSLVGIYKSQQTVEYIANFMSLYFDSTGAYYEVFGKRFEERFPTEFGKILTELKKIR
ncbi:MAG TPA: hypothetical protein PKL31_04070 [Fulvivirga sp.]|nr:hypothetical protein [Fulvivirga sp.]